MKYSSFIFDCDGVLLDTNRIKTEAYRTVAGEHGEVAADALVRYHRAHGGVSRFEKMRWLHESILGAPAEAPATQRAIRQSIARFGGILRKELPGARETPGLRGFLDALPTQSRRFVVSGAEQDELRHSLKARKLLKYFDNAFGSPRTKNEILESLQSGGLLPKPGVFFGDALLDWEVASGAGMDFVFVHGFTEFDEWRDFFRSCKGVVVVKDFEEASGISTLQ